MESTATRRTSLTKFLRFSLSTFLLAVTVFAVWLGVGANRARRQKAAVRALANLDIQVRYHHQYVDGQFTPEAKSNVPQWLQNVLGAEFFLKAHTIDFAYRSRFPHGDHRVDDDDLAPLADLPDLKYLELARNPITDAGLVHLRNLKKLETLYLYTTDVEGPGLTHLQGATNLTSLSMPRSRLNDEGLRALGGMSNLNWLRLATTNISDDGLPWIGKLTKLKDLDLSFNDVGDAGLAQLHELKQLEVLGLSCTNVTTEGVAKFQAAVPNCTVHLSYGLGKEPVAVDLSSLPDPSAMIQKLKELGADIELDQGSRTDLRIHNAEISDATAIQLLRAVGDVHFLNIRRVLFGDEFANFIPDLPALLVLDMQDSRLTDEGLKHISRAQQLTDLSITDNHITDAGLAHLERMKNLERLNIGRTRVTVGGSRKLQQALPNCNITY